MLACCTLLACFTVPDRDLRRLVKQVSNGQEMFTLDELQGFLDKLVAARFFTSTPAEAWLWRAPTRTRTASRRSST